MKNLIKKFLVLLWVNFSSQHKRSSKDKYCVNQRHIGNLNRSIDLTETASWEFSGFSQNGEDGIIDILCNQINVERNNILLRLGLQMV